MTPDSIHEQIATALHYYMTRTNSKPSRMYLGRLEDACLDLNTRRRDYITGLDALRESLGLERRTYQEMEIYVVDAPSHLAFASDYCHA